MEPNKKAKLRSLDDTSECPKNTDIVEFYKKNYMNLSRNLLKTPPNDFTFVHILPRLPVKSLLRFETVCKDWHSEISSPKFVKTHLQFSSSFSLHFLLMHITDDNERHLFLLPYDESNNNVKELVPLHSEHFDKHAAYMILGSWNGLLCMYFMDRDFFSFWNPATHRYQPVSNPQLALEVVDDLEDCFEWAEFCYASSIDEYKILAIYYDPNDYEISRFYLFSSKAGAWKRLFHLDGFLYGRRIAYGRCVSVDGNLYIVCRNEEDYYEVLEFDVVEEKMGVVTGTNWLNGYQMMKHAFSMKGCLALSCLKKNEQVCDVWRLKRDDAVNCWQKLFSFDDLVACDVVGFSNTGKFLVDHLQQYKVVDPSLKVADLSPKGVNHNLYDTRAFHYFESFLSPSTSTSSSVRIQELDEEEQN